VPCWRVGPWGVNDAVEQVESGPARGTRGWWRVEWTVESGLDALSLGRLLCACGVGGDSTRLTMMW
jgi:hypothetical protein